MRNVGKLIWLIAALLISVSCALWLTSPKPMTLPLPGGGIVFNGAEKARLVRYVTLSMRLLGQGAKIDTTENIP